MKMTWEGLFKYILQVQQDSKPIHLSRRPVITRNDAQRKMLNFQLSRNQSILAASPAHQTNISNMLILLLPNIIFLPHLCCIQSPRPQATWQLPRFSFDYRRPNLKLSCIWTLNWGLQYFNEQAACEGLVYYRSWLLLWLSNWKMIIKCKLGEDYFSCLPNRLQLAKFHKQEGRTWKIRSVC